MSLDYFLLDNYWQYVGSVHLYIGVLVHQCTSVYNRWCKSMCILYLKMLSVSLKCGIRYILESSKFIEDQNKTSARQQDTTVLLVNSRANDHVHHNLFYSIVYLNFKRRYNYVY